MGDIQRSDKRKRFFYAELYAGMYDETISMVCPYYDIAHSTANELINNHIQSVGKENFKLLDIGAGTGAESIPLLKRFPESYLVAIDFCKPMKKVFVENLEKEIDQIENRFIYLTEDFLDYRFPPEVNEKEYTNQGNFDVVITAYTFHHFQHEEKKAAYEKAFKLLNPGGLFINIDLFSYKSQSLSSFALEYDLNYIRRNLIESGTNSEIGEKWLIHYQNDNILEPAGDQCNMLKDAGFNECGVPFRFMQNGIIFAKKR